MYHINCIGKCDRKEAYFTMELCKKCDNYMYKSTGERHDCAIEMKRISTEKIEKDISKLKNRVKKIEKTVSYKKPKSLVSNDDIARELLRRLYDRNELDKVVRESLASLLNVPLLRDRKLKNESIPDGKVEGND